MNAWAVPFALLLGAGGMAAFFALRDEARELEQVEQAVALRDELRAADDEPEVEPEPEVAVPVDDPELDPERLTPQDLAFLEEVLAEGIPEGRISAAKVLWDSSNPLGVPLLFDAVVRHPEQADLFCMAALQIVRLQTKEAAVELLWQAMERQPPLGRECLAEVRDRFALVGGRDPTVLVVLATSPEPKLRAWVARALADVEAERVEEALLDLAVDPIPGVREAAWVALGERTISDLEALRAAQEQEQEPELVELAAEAGR